MTPQFADLLAARYIQNMEDQDSQIVRIMDLYDTKQDKAVSLKATIDARFEDIKLNYKTLSEYS